MDVVSLFTLIIGLLQFFGAILVGILVWWMKKLVTDIREIQKDLAQFRAEVPKDYVLKQDYKDVVDRIFQKLDYLVVEERKERGNGNHYNQG